MARDIVEVNVTVINAARPNNLQQKTLFLSYGSTTTKPGTISLISELQDYIDLTNVAITALTSEELSSGQKAVTVTFAPETTLNVTGEATITITGCLPATFNGVYSGSFSTNTFTFTSDDYPVGTPNLLGAFNLSDTELLNDFTLYFSQLNTVSPYLIEFGQNDDAESMIASLQTQITSNDEGFYTYKVRDAFDEEPTFIALAKQFESPQSKTYFIINTADTTGAYKDIKSIIPIVYNVDASVPDDIEPAAAISAIIASTQPSTLTKVPPFCYRFIYNAAVYDAKNSVKEGLESNFINYIESAAEGGLSNTMLVQGVTADGNDILYWYCVDWTQINAQLQLANAVINGSNNPVNPLYYDQDGIDRLLLVIQSLAARGQQYGLYNGAPICTAIPFDEYVASNPDDYQQGIYKGLKMSIVPSKGFKRIVFNLIVTIPGASA